MDSVFGGMSDAAANERSDMGNDLQNTQGTPDGDVEADTASGGAPEKPDTSGQDDGSDDDAS